MISSHKTKYSADSIETRPGDRTKFACATYQLDSGGTERHGNVSILDFQEKSVKVSSVLETGGVLDLWWRDEGCLLAACASGELRMIEVDKDCVLNERNVANVSSDILLAVDGSSNTVVTSDTAGIIYSINPESLDISVKIEAAHGAQGWGAEVWGLALDRHDVNLVYSGGDDCLLKCHDLRTPHTVSTSRYHTMGVCCISPDPVSPNRILSGSYDEMVVEWDTRDFKQPLRTVSVGGGVWRIKRSPDNAHALIAGMHSGFHIVNLTEFVVAQTYTGHTSLAYGADWLDQGFVATCSFYDNLVNVWHSSV